MPDNSYRTTENLLRERAAAKSASEQAEQARREYEAACSDPSLSRQDREALRENAQAATEQARDIVENWRRRWLE